MKPCLWAEIKNLMKCSPHFCVNATQTAVKTQRNVCGFAEVFPCKRGLSKAIFSRMQRLYILFIQEWACTNILLLLLLLLLLLVKLYVLLNFGEECITWFMAWDHNLSAINDVKHKLTNNKWFIVAPWSTSSCALTFDGVSWRFLLMLHSQYDTYSTR